jgi:hypothetical protein
MASAAAKQMTAKTSNAKGLLVKRPFVVLKATDERAALAKKAETLLGYSAYRKHLKQPSVLGKTLLKLGIEPYDSNSVEMYKQEMVKAVKTRYHSNGYYNYTVRWDETALNRYTKPIPEHVLLKAVQIKEALPATHRKKATFEVEEIQVSRERATRYVDPFISVSLLEEKFYFEVWDEPRFEDNLGRLVFKQKRLAKK